MVKYIPIDDNIFIKFDDGTMTSTVLRKDDLAKEQTYLYSRLQELPAPVTDEELLAWAKINHTSVDYERERESIQSRLIEIEADLAGVS